MTIDPTGGTMHWDRPMAGTYRVLTRASNAAGEDYVEWLLVVVEPGSPDALVVSSKHTDYVVPVRIATWIKERNALAHVDAGFEYMQALVGQDFGWPMGGKQIVHYDAQIGGLGQSGNPVNAGPPWWSEDPIRGWELGVWNHEVGHNFAETLPGAKLLLADNWAGEVFHGFVEMLTVPLTRRAVQNPAKFGLSEKEAANYAGYVRWRDQETDRRLEPYVERLRRGGRAQGYNTEPSILWAKICRMLCDRYGADTIEKTVCALRKDGLPLSIYQEADTALKKNTLLFSILSTVAGQDLRREFDLWGFDSDSAFYVRISPMVAAAMAHLPDEDRLGWKRCPVNGHHYRLTPWMTGWHEAERMARRYGGHLATIRSAAEEAWFLSRFRTWGLWIGLSDEFQEGRWAWASGEPLEYQHWLVGEPSGVRPGTLPCSTTCEPTKRGLLMDQHSPGALSRRTG